MSLYIKDIVALENAHGTAAQWTAQVPAFKALQQARVFDFTHSITVITGENGVGKSTLLEAIAVNAGFSVHGGPFDGRFNSFENPLRNVAKAHVGPQAMAGYFLRSESYFNVAATYGAEAPGWVNLHEMSHGESVMHIVQQGFVGTGLYLLDEPESGLSFIRQMALLAQLHDIAAGGSQIIVVTHSPVLLAIPGAEIWEFSADAQLHRGVELEETTAFRALGDFMDDPVGIADYMVEITRPDKSE